MNLDKLNIQGTTNNQSLNNPTEEKDSNSKNSDSEKEKIKKIRIPKMEDDLREEGEKVTMDYFRGMAKNYIRDRLQRLTKDRKSLEKLQKMNSDNNEMAEFIDKRIESIKEEQKKLRKKLKDLQEGKTIYLETDNLDQKTIFGPDFKKTITPSILLFAAGLVLIYIGSEYGLLPAYGIMFLSGLIFILVMSILDIF